jgi:hypothetical protein
VKTLELSDEERRELASLLTIHLSHLRLEIAGTNSFDFREALRRRELVLAKLLRGLE